MVVGGSPWDFGMEMMPQTASMNTVEDICMRMSEVRADAMARKEAEEDRCRREAHRADLQRRKQVQFVNPCPW